MLQERPDIALVYGDTNSTLAGALAAAKLHIPVAHVEAGLRSFNMRMPEEINRIITDRVSTWLYAPTEEAVEHLQREGTDPVRVQNVGDVMYDVALHHGERASRLGGGAVERLGLNGKGYVLVTVHRAENTDHAERLHVIVSALIEVGRQMPVVWPLHPRTRSVLNRAGLLVELEGIVQLIEPLGYLDMVRLERAAAVIATDSGGVQKEAFFHGVPCVTLRDETEWVELVASGWNRLVAPINSAEVARAILHSIGSVGSDISPYGKGDAAARIVQSLDNAFNMVG
jgi:UDP-GlcNAc3NAcA epimerase